MDDQTRDRIEAAAFRRLLRHLAQRTDVQNIDLMGIGGFCRNCLGDWLEEAAEMQGVTLSKADARTWAHGMPQTDWKARHHTEATPEQLARMKMSLAKNAALDEALDESFPASDPPAMTRR